MAVADEDEVRVDAKRGVQFGKALAEHPMGGDATVVQEAGRCQQERRRSKPKPGVAHAAPWF